MPRPLKIEAFVFVVVNQLKLKTWTALIPLKPWRAKHFPGSRMPANPQEIICGFCATGQRLSQSGCKRSIAPRRAVHLENYIIEEDEVGAAFAAALIRARQRGVACKVIYDWLGCLARTSQAFWRRLAEAGVEVRHYNPPRFVNPVRLISRDHRKILCIDGALAFTGGLCIGHDWVGNPARGVPPWRDTAVEIRGPAVADIEAAFADSWGFVGGGRLPPAAAPVPAAGGCDVSVIAGRPEAMGLYRLEQLVAAVAARSLWLTDGYFVATTAYVRALGGAARMGVDVRLLVPGSSNWPLVGALSKAAYRPLLQAGVRVFEWNGPMLHAKTAVADGCWTRIGSSNSNLASWVSNRELDVTSTDRDARPADGGNLSGGFAGQHGSPAVPGSARRKTTGGGFPGAEALARENHVRAAALGRDRARQHVGGLAVAAAQCRAGGGAAYLHRRPGAGLSRRCSLSSCRA